MKNRVGAFISSTAIRGFTIVELLVVIVVIGILAAITVVSYTGITNRAILASVQSDLSNASKQLSIFYTEHDYYPLTIDCDLPDSDTNKCIKASTNNSYTYTPLSGSDPSSYTLSINNSSDSETKYVITNDSSISMKSAPLGPAADWLAIPQGDHYGNFYDLVANQYATITRSSPKTIYDPTANKIYDVPANYLGIRPRSDGNSGYEAEIEESRTNYLKNSSFEDDANQNGVAEYWSPQSTTTVYPKYSVANDNVHNSNSQLIEYTGQISDTTKLIDFYQGSYSASFAEGDSATFSLFHKGVLSGVTFRMQIQAINSSYANIGSVQLSGITVGDKWSKSTLSYPSLPAGTDYLLVAFWIEHIDEGDEVELYIDAAQLEKGTFATSYIPTTANAVVRGADNVTVPSDVWKNNLGTIFTSSYKYENSSGSGFLWAWGSASTNDRIYSYIQSGGYSQFNLAVAGVYNEAGIVSAASDYRTYAGRWGTSMYNVMFIDNSTNAASSGLQTTFSSNLNNVVSLGSSAYSSSYRNGSIQRLVVYNKALGSGNGEISLVFNAIKDGP